MKTKIFLIRHSIPLKNKIDIQNSDSLQITNEKNPLSVEGEEKAKILSEKLNEIDEVFSSNYVRTIGTAKYIAEKNNLNIKIIEDFGERKFGINSWDEKPKDFEDEQMKNENFKMPNGESRKETADRIYKALMSVLEEYKGKKIAIVSHATVITFLFMKLGKITDGNITYNDEIIIDKNFVWNAPEVFELEFENDELIKIENKKE
ncbi:MAG: histidine phosphatase family protein [Bacilli bacterium]|nr:histidine phosphatase family protein [Bacilli bacterium]